LYLCYVGTTVVGIITEPLWWELSQKDQNHFVNVCLDSGDLRQNHVDLWFEKRIMCVFSCDLRTSLSYHWVIDGCENWEICRI